MRKLFLALAFVAASLSDRGVRWRRHHRGWRRSTASADCTKASLATKTAGTLTFGTDNPAFPPWFRRREEQALGDQRPRHRRRLRVGRRGRGRDRARVRRGRVTWAVTVRHVVRAGPQGLRRVHQPGVDQPGASPERRLLERLLQRQPGGRFVGDKPIASAASIADLKGYKLGAAVGTTSLNAIEDKVAPDDQPGCLQHQRRRGQRPQGRADRRHRRRPADRLLRDRRAAGGQARSSGSSRPTAHLSSSAWCSRKAAR